MKKIIAILMLICMVFALAACGAKPAEYKLGMGIAVKDNSKTGTAQVDACAAAVVLDKDGKIVACRIDVAQNKMDVTDGAVDPEATFRTKAEKKEDYGMVAYGGATYEWYQQAQAFEQYTVGKTADEIANIATAQNGEHTVFADETLYATCSIDITEFQAAVVKACNDEQGTSFTTADPFTLGLAIKSTAKDTTAPTAEEDGVVKMYSDFGAAVVGKDGKILAALTDAIQPQIKINAAGENTEFVFNGTKRELKEGYNMVAYSDATLEWYQQAKNFTDYAAGKTAAELRATETVQNGEHIVFADETLYASCSIQIVDMIDVVAGAAEIAR